MSMPFSTPEQVQKSYDFLHKMNKPACPGCARGVRMCYHTPCIGTPEDISKLLDAGYAKNLMLDWWVGQGTKEKSIKDTFGLDKPTKSLERISLILLQMILITSYLLL